jgi:hypothetical protein
VEGETTAAMYTNAFLGRRGYDAVFYKAGHLFATNVGIAVGGKGVSEANAFISTVASTTDAGGTVYLNLQQQNGEINIGNIAFAENVSGGTVDDAYIVNSENAKFADISDPDAWEAADSGDGTARPTGDAGRAYTEAIKEENLAGRNEMAQVTSEQMNAHLEAMKEEVDETDEYDVDYAEVVAGMEGAFGDLVNEMETFFEGYKAVFNPDLDEEE